MLGASFRCPIARPDFVGAGVRCVSCSSARAAWLLLGAGGGGGGVRTPGAPPLYAATVVVRAGDESATEEDEVDHDKLHDPIPQEPGPHVGEVPVGTSTG